MHLIHRITKKTNDTEKQLSKYQKKLYIETLYFYFNVLNKKIQQRVK